MHELDEGGSSAYHFEGLENLNGVVFPEVLLDRVMANLTGAEFKVLAYIVRRTLGFRKEFDTISLEQICSGVKQGDGRLLDEGTGLSKKTAIAALKGLEDKGVIIAHKRMTRDKGNLPTAFAIRLKEHMVIPQALLPPTSARTQNNAVSEARPRGVAPSLSR